ncbi:oligopeptide/dipeptide ABC transporter ATP-binding protein [Streptomyces sp. NPDC049906]|uniref:ABC transporter ATP-binding protein n=1 Tax=Streptomyces sp. NPDC049906 TaxID=3155656 RepID=UPI0034132039
MSANEPLLSVDNLSVRYGLGRGMTGRRRSFTAVRDVSFTIGSGRTLGLVGESGSGKSTIGRAILRLAPVSEGTVVFDGQDISGFGRQTPLSYRKDVQVVFQDPLSSLNPRQTVATIIGQTIARHRSLSRAALDKEVARALDDVGLSAFHGDRMASELSGGQRQRVAIARALSVRPKLIVCDEPVSALDVSTQSQVINLLMELQREYGISYLFIAHDLDVVRHVSHDIAVLYLGRMAESGPAEAVHGDPGHPYTHMLMASSLVTDPDEQAERSRLRRKLTGGKAEPPSPLDDKPGCPYQNRCRWATDLCRTETPRPVSLPLPQLPAAGSGERLVACHHAEEVRGSRTAA